MSALRLAPPAANLKRRGSNLYLRSPQKLGPFARCVTDWLVRWSDEAPERTFLAERKGDGWRRISYREAYGAVRRIGQALLERGLDAERPVAILSDNSIDHALLALGAMHVGIPAAPISPAYSLMSQDFGKLIQSDLKHWTTLINAVGAKIVAAIRAAKRDILWV